MNMRKCQRAGLVGIAVLITAGIAAGQNIEVTPLVGTRLYGTVKLESDDAARTGANIAGSITYGVAAGYRWESADSADHDLIEFRWVRQDSHLYIKPSIPK